MHQVLFLGSGDAWLDSFHNTRKYSLVNQFLGLSHAFATCLS